MVSELKEFRHNYLIAKIQEKLLVDLTMTLKSEFSSLTDHNDLARFFGMSYKKLASIIYPDERDYRYTNFTIPKRNGSDRTIHAPSKKLKAIQRKLSAVLYEIYPGRPASHGYCKGRSTISNANNHLAKTFVFNMDLKDFFSSIHFGRVKNLFQSSPFHFDHSIASILAQISCFENSLPQGAPSSPIISNMLLWKMDSQLQKLARRNFCTYTRYADDMTFSFSRSQLPTDIVFSSGDGTIAPGDAIESIIKNNGFLINNEKTRLRSRYQSMDVTGITVNKFPNVKREYIRQIGSMLHAWKVHGCELAGAEFYSRYDKRHRASDVPKIFQHVVRGKLLYLRNVRSSACPIYIKLAMRFNELADDVPLLKVPEDLSAVSSLCDSTWIFQACYDDEKGVAVASQGTAIQLRNGILVTCAHVVLDEKNRVLKEISACKPGLSEQAVEVLSFCRDRDIAICRRAGYEETDSKVELETNAINIGDSVTLIGYPGYGPGDSHYMVDTSVASLYVKGAANHFEIGTQIREGNSGGPVVDENSRLVGMALSGATKSTGKNGCLSATEILKFIESAS